MKAKLTFDGSSLGNPGPAAGAAILESDCLHIPLTAPIGRATNNEAEYRGLIIGLREAMRQGVKDLEIRGDSKLVVEQVKGNYKAKARNLQILLDEAKFLLSNFSNYTISWIPREQNGEADRLAGWSASTQMEWSED